MEQQVEMHYREENHGLTSFFPRDFSALSLSQTLRSLMSGLFFFFFFEMGRLFFPLAIFSELVPGIL